MRVSTDVSEEAWAGLLDLAGGDAKLVMKALEPDANGDPVKFEDALQRIVQMRLELDRAVYAHNLTKVSGT
ncbi:MULTISPECIES: hypothetical protein [unclassified Paraburkholderia]|uniref:hypothetical protein n=1 Tax=unclassified Paraburkholderia TaxID=2615204 RepID=UPI00160D17DE|nr:MULTISPECIES: hypothetical protein [unclassified Paraburkholderia]MBB5448084.1 hypothetical protein [Paraburkholderia sp. WSM4177]MBB5488499.1 hypothetical protein [Paraburkholderia sp. WSM4180]